MAAKLVRWGMEDWRDGGTLHCVKVIFSWDMKCTKTTNQVACDLEEVTTKWCNQSAFLKKIGYLELCCLQRLCFRGNHYLNDTHRQTRLFFFYSNFYLILLFIYCFQCYNFFFTSLLASLLSLRFHCFVVVMFRLLREQIKLFVVTVMETCSQLTFMGAPFAKGQKCIYLFLHINNHILKKEKEKKRKEKVKYFPYTLFWVN